MPVVTTRHIAEGYQKGNTGRIVNPPEAEEIARHIHRLCGDPMYRDKSIGVISLLGEAQARLIEKLLLDKIGAQEMERRGIVCGDAYAFQGDERDVIFLSLVSAPVEGKHISVLADERAKRRFNVAASRARDQLWLFHTATLNDLAPTCLRYQLLQYCQNPRVDPLVMEGIDIYALRIAANGQREKAKQPHPFDSWFEVDVFLRIVQKGYRVIPQFEMAGRRIDLVVAGMKGRVAVECDGDFWHGAEDFERDMARQRMLERCGWTFWRVPGSDFYRDPEGSLEDLWLTLGKLGVHPGSMNEPQSARRPDGMAESGAPGPSTPLGSSSNPNHEERDPIQPFLLSDEASHSAPQNNKAGLAHGEEGLRTGSRQNDEKSNCKVRPFLADYRNWHITPLPDPRRASTNEVIRGLQEIIGVEGPMPCHRAYHIYAKAAGIQKVGRQIRSVFNRAVHQAVLAKLLEEVNEHGTTDQMNRIVRKWGTPPIIPRQRADRTFYEIPPSELGAVMSLLLEENPGIGSEEILRSVTDHYQIERLTSGIRAALSGQLERIASGGA